MLRRTIAIAIALTTAGISRAALVFNFSGDVSQQMLDGFTAAGQRWSSRFSNDMTVNIGVSAANLGTSSIASSHLTNVSVSYASVRDALVSGATSSDDQLSISHLSAGQSFNFLTNDDQTGSVILDNNASADNTIMLLTQANAKALQLTDPQSTSFDSQITFNTALTYDFDPSDGIAAGAVDFTAVATHEIGHALGFDSGVDLVDARSAPRGNRISFDNIGLFSPLDLFRYSSTSFAQNLPDESTTGVIYFSLDGGATNLGLFSTGALNGDGQQASHWKRLSGEGIMDPTFTRGQARDISPLDVRAFDVIGYTLIPEPSSVALLLALPLFTTRPRRRTSPQ